MARRGRTANLRASARKAYAKVATTRSQRKCGRSSRGAKKQVCLSTAEIPGMRCGKNPINGLYACVEGGKGRKRARAKRKR